MAIAAFILGLADRMPESSDYKKKIRERVPNYAMADFLAAFRYAPDAVTMFQKAAKKIGIS
jgi:hypothetical protein